MAEALKAKKPKKASLAALSLVPEQLSTAGKARESCQGCALFQRCEEPFAKPFVPKGWTKRLLVVLDAPDPPRAEKRLLKRLLRAAGYGPLDVAYAYAVRCRPRKGDPSMKQVRSCRPFLLRVLVVLQPQVVVALGSTALKALTNDGSETNVTAARGRQLDVPGLSLALGGDGTSGGAVPPSQPLSVPRVYTTYHPNSVLHGAGHLERLILDDLKRAGWKETPYPVPAWPNSEAVALDTEYAPDGSLLTVALANTTHAAAEDVVDGKPASAEFYRALNGAKTLAGHSLAGDLDQLAKLGIASTAWLDGTKQLDSLLLARLADENLGKGAYKLERQLLGRRNVRPWKDETEAIGPDATKWPPEARVERCRLDAWASAVLARDLIDHVNTETQNPKLVTFTHQIAMVIHRIGLAGAAVDLGRLGEIETTLHGEMERSRELLQRAAYRAGMTEFTPTNDEHLRTLLFRKLGLPVLERTRKDKKAKVDKVTLKNLGEKHKVPKLILDFNKAEKLYSTYVVGVKEALRPYGDGLGWLEVRINPLGARTGRRSSGGRDEDGDVREDAAPNMQNWPGCKKTCPADCRRHPKQIVVSRFPGGLIGNFDYKSLEPFILAWVTGDERLYEAFATGGGYIAFGRDLFGRDIEKDTEPYRALKSVILGTHYGAEEWKIAYQLWNEVGIRLAKRWERHLELTAELRKKYLDAVPGVKRYMRERREELLRTQRVVGVLGRIRHLPHPFTVRPQRGTPEWKHWKHLANEAINFPIQWAAATVTGSALIDVERELLAAYKVGLADHHRDLVLTGGRVDRSVLINEVHDALVLDLHPEYAKRDTEIVIETMRAVPTLRRLLPTFDLKLDVDPKVGPRWGG